MYGDPNDPLTQYMMLQGTTQGGSAGSPIAQNNPVDYTTDPSGNNYQRPSSGLSYVQQQLQRLRDKQGLSNLGNIYRQWNASQMTPGGSVNTSGFNANQMGQYNKTLSYLEGMSPAQRNTFMSTGQLPSGPTPGQTLDTVGKVGKGIVGGLTSILGAMQAGAQSKAQAASNILSQKRTSIAPGPQQFAYNRMLNQQEETLGQNNKDQEVAST
jgi:hypothetical protein